nr:hypothetical protein [Tanacetum cinerariifolium]
MTRILDKNEGHNYKATGNDVPGHLRTLEIKRHEFMKWIKECQLLVGLKLPTDMHMYDGFEDLDSHVWQFECAAKINAWNSLWHAICSS